MLSSLSKLTAEDLAEIRKLEQELGKTLLSFSGYDVIAGDLSDDELVRVRELEKKTGTALVAVDPLKVKGE
ncbi:hypothetical protein [Chlorobium limicola]|uniref:Uncharacterized protein n=1 Tax=Chlorobium limicola TaxID=1092 RepID=A0A124GAE8_CHLLI|nr:hypothetical protein [Chlorobium limicola]KUL32020.1 hypothetical protein ASB62_02110 [Chlorobium limicola]